MFTTVTMVEDSSTNQAQSQSLQKARNFLTDGVGHDMQARNRRKLDMATALADSVEIACFISTVDELLASIELEIGIDSIIHDPEVMKLYCQLGELSERRAFYITKRSEMIASFCAMSSFVFAAFINFYNCTGVHEGLPSGHTYPSLVTEWLNVGAHTPKIQAVVHGVATRKLKLKSHIVEK